MTGEKKNRYQELDALRGIAALVVVFFHFTMNRPEANLGFRFGITGVELFFIISGFVIFMSLGRVTKSIDFVINRFCRLYPTYWTAVTITFIIISLHVIYTGIHQSGIGLSKYLANMTMFQFYLRVENIDGPYWTMIVEMLFYIGILCLYHFNLLKYINKIGISICLVLAFGSLFCANNPIFANTIYWLPILKYFPLFFVGTLFYKIYINKARLFQNYSIISFCLIVQILLFKTTNAPHFINQFEYSILLVIYFSLFLLFVNNKLRFIVSRVTLFIGKISFALYLIHHIVFTEILIPILINHFHLNFWISSFFIALPIAIIEAALITFCVEIPLNKLLKMKLQKIVLLFSSHQSNFRRLKSGTD